ncbi:MAG: EAL domain-containing protein [Devosia sp.]|nr:EAL domain-containing protein [Devosia sp.]
MAALVRSLVAAALVAAVFLVAATGIYASLDRILADIRYSLTNRAASTDLLFVDIDSSSLARIGVWPWPRDVHAEVLDRLMELGARDVAFDIDFSTRSSDAADAAFTAALNRAGGFTYLAAFEQPDGASGRIVLNQPIAPFLAEAVPVIVNVGTDTQGLVDRVPLGLAVDGGILPSLAAALAGQPPRTADVLIDYGIDPHSIARVSVADLVDGRVAAETVAGRQAIIGASAIELRDQFAVPRFGYLAGPLIQALAAETLKAGQPMRNWGPWPGLATALLLAIGFAPLGRRLKLGPAVPAAALVMLGMEGAALLLKAEAGVMLSTASFHIAVLFLLALRLLDAFLVEFAARQRAQARLAYLARHDEVTGLRSRRGLIEALHGRSGETTLLAIGILRLGQVRGALGQGVHDEALRIIADRLAELRLGELALIERDIFAVALGRPAYGPALAAFGPLIRNALRPALALPGHSVHVDVAIGSVTGDDPAERLLQRVEMALDEARRDHLRGVLAYTDALEQAISRRRKIDAGLRQALASGALSVVFQPQVRLSDGELVGVEALVRWEDPELGAVSPADFIPLAEETGLIVPIGGFVLQEACRIVAGWNWTGKLAVNISAVQLQVSDVGAAVAAALGGSGLPPGRLDIEITESLLVDRSGRVAATIAELRRHGIGIAIDDFGSGYSALSYLADFPFDKLKIDQTFTRGLTADSSQAAIIRAVTDLAQRLGKLTVCEGVETEFQRDLLTRLGCDVGQGYLFGRPMPGEEIVALLERCRVGAQAGQVGCSIPFRP